MAIVFPASPSVNDTFTEGSITYKWDGAKWIGLGVTPIDRLIEGSNKLEIDANNDLLWDGGRVGFGGNGIGSGLGVYLQRSSPATTHFYEASDGTKKMISGVDSTNDYVKIGSLSNHRVGLVANNGEKLSILPSGDVGINQTSPTSQSGKVLHISGDTGGQARIHLSTSASGHGINEGHYIVSQGTESGSVAGQLAFINMENRNFVFTTGSEGANATRLTIQHDGNVNIADGNLIVAAGHGIDFSANANSAGMSSELLDDYEEGTFTPEIFGLTVSSSYGHYVKVGSLVTCVFYIDIGGKTYIGSGGGTTSLQIILPFNNSNVTAAYAGLSIGNVRNIDFSSGSVKQFAMNIGGTSNRLTGRWIKHNSNFVDVVLGDLYNSFSIHASVTYQAA